jgi:putative ABC transport system permease protein
LRGVALRSLVHERGKAAASLLGIACAASLLFVEIGLYVGLTETSSALISRAGGDVWLVARGTEVLDNGQPVSAAKVSQLRAVPCVRGVRELVLAMLPVRKATGALDYVQVVGIDPGATPRLPWSWHRGGPSDLGPGKVAVDEGDLEKLKLPPDPRGRELRVAERTVTVAATTRGIRSFALVPYVFADVGAARTLAGLADGAVTYAIADGKTPGCVDDVRRAFAGDREVDVRGRAELASMTETFWMEGSGAGATLGASALFSVIVGAVTVGQTLYSITRDHLRELATLKAMGAHTSELVAFVVWQTVALAGTGGGLGLGIAWALRAILEAAGVTMSLSPRVHVLGAAAIAAMCLLAALPSLLRVRRVSALEVLR